MNDSIKQSTRIKELENQVMLLSIVKNPLLGKTSQQIGTNKYCLTETLYNVSKVLTYLMLNDSNDEGMDSAIEARELLTECALNAIDFVNENIGTIQVEL